MCNESPDRWRVRQRGRQESWAPDFREETARSVPDSFSRQFVPGDEEEAPRRWAGGGGVFRSETRAPRIMGTGFSRRNSSVRSRLVLPPICSRRRGGGSKTLGGRRRRFRADAFCSAPRGSSFTKSSSIGSII